MKTSTKLNIIGSIWLAFGIAAIVNTLYYREQGLAPILWLCYLLMIILAIGAFRKDSLLIASQLSILAIPILLWNVDFFYYLFRGETLLYIVGYYFIPGPII